MKIRWSEWFGENPTSWIADKGKPATCLEHKGFPTAEHDICEGFCVMGLCVVSITSEYVMVFPAWYGTAAILSEESTVSLHHGVNADWNWRMNIYKLRFAFISNGPLVQTYWERLGSQMEITWRNGLNEMQHYMYGGDDGPNSGPIPRAPLFEEVADRMLCRHLTPFQQLEFKTKGTFRVVGGKTGDHYKIQLGNGFALIDPVTTQTLVNFCLHTEHWIPAADQALALKLALEDEEMEAEVLSGARPYPHNSTREPTENERLAYEHEVGWELVR